MLINYFYLFRIKHWIKNLIIFTPYIFARKFNDTENLVLLFQVFLIFCLLSSTIYIINDICDLKEDSKSDIKKKEKPIANNKISLKTAKYLVGTLLILDLVLLINFSSIFLYGIFFLILNILYSYIFKNIIILDAISISFSYLLRLFAGGSIILVSPSIWLVTLVFFVSLFVVFSKRYSEAIIMKDHSRLTVLNKYKKLYLYLVFSNCFLSLLIYTLYVFVKNIDLILTIPITFFIFYRMIYNLYKSKSKIISPVNTVLMDKWLLISLFAWTLVIFFNNFLNNLFLLN